MSKIQAVKAIQKYTDLPSRPAEQLYETLPEPVKKTILGLVDELHQAEDELDRALSAGFRALGQSLDA